MSVSRCLFALVVALAGGSAICGCTLLPIADVFGFWPPATGNTTSALPPLQPARETVQVEFTFIDRPVGDPLLGTGLWNEIDQVGAVTGAEADSLKRLGLRVGNAGATISPALERLLRSTDSLDAADSPNRIAVKKETMCIGPGVSPPITINSGRKCTIDVPVLTGTKEQTYDNFKSVLRLTAHRLQDGWAKLEFVPEIHFGQERLRATSATAGLENVWQPNMSQETESLLAQRFSVKLHVGEFVVLTAVTDNPRLFGFQGFVHDEAGKGQIQRVLIVRLANMAKIDPVYSESGASE